VLPDEGTYTREHTPCTRSFAELAASAVGREHTYVVLICDRVYMVVWQHA